MYNKAVHIAVLSRHIDRVEVLLAEHLDYTDGAYSGRTAMHLTAWYRHCKVV